MKEMLEKLKDLNMNIDSKSAVQLGKYWFWKEFVAQAECVLSNVIWSIFWLIIFFKAIPFIINLLHKLN